MARNLTCEDIKHVQAFIDLKTETVKQICTIADRRILKKGEILFKEKDRISKFYAVLSGKVSMYRLSTNGQKRVFFILGEGSLVNEVVFDDLPVSVVCEGFEEAVIAEFTKQEFLKIMENDFKLTLNILNSIGRKQRRLYRQLKNTLPIGMDKRLAAKLWKLGKDNKGEDLDGWSRLDINLSVTYLSYMLGTSRESISRSLKVLIDKGFVKWIERNLYIKEIELLDYYRSE